MDNVQDMFSIYFTRQIDFLKSTQATTDGVTIKDIKGSNIASNPMAEQYIILKDQYLCTVDERFTSESIQNAQQIDFPPFIITTLQEAKKEICFWFKYLNYPNYKNQETVSLLFDLSYQKIDE